MNTVVNVIMEMIFSRGGMSLRGVIQRHNPPAGYLVLINDGGRPNGIFHLFLGHLEKLVILPDWVDGILPLCRDNPKSRQTFHRNYCQFVDAYNY